MSAVVKHLPFDEEAYRREQAFIGAVIIGHDKHGIVDLSPEDFTNSQFSAVWAYCQDTREIDNTAIAHKFGDELLAKAVACVPSSANLQKCASHVRQLAFRRRVCAALRKAADLVNSGSPIADVSHYIMAAFDGVPSECEAKHIRDLAVDAYHLIEKAQVEGEQVCFVQSGLNRLDAAIGGLPNSGVTLVAGRPSMGKTSFILRLARHAGKSGYVLVVSMEMSGEQLAMRFLAAENGVDLQAMMQGKLTPSDWSGLANASSKLSKANIWINDKTSRSVGDVAAEARRFKRKHGGIALLVVDYLTLLKMPRSDTKANAVGDISRAFKVLAGELKCPVVLVSQLNRKLEERTNKTPLMSDLRDSGALEQDADQIIFLYRPEVYNRQPENAGLAEIIVAKNRNGRTGKITMEWVAESATFRDFCDE